jgi:hypothetical protein
MTADEQITILNTSAISLLNKLNAEGRTAGAVVTVVLFREHGKYYINTAINPAPEEEERTRVEGDLLIVVSDVLDKFVHERGLCTHCATREKVTLQ